MPANKHFMISSHCKLTTTNSTKKPGGEVPFAQVPPRSPFSPQSPWIPHAVAARQSASQVPKVELPNQRYLTFLGVASAGQDARIPRNAAKQSPPPQMLDCRPTTRLITGRRPSRPTKDLSFIQIGRLPTLPLGKANTPHRRATS